MLYGVLYQRQFQTKREEAAYQRQLARRLLFYAMGGEYGVDAAGLDLRKTSAGKPFFADHPARFSLSHCPGLVCCGVGREEIGVDCEPIRPFDFRLAERICTREELDSLEGSPRGDVDLTVLWTLKESLMKLSGKGMSYGFRNAAFSFAGGRPSCAVPGIKAASFLNVPGFAVSACSHGEPPDAILLVGEEQVS